MTGPEAVVVVLAGVFAGGINAVVGSGTLVTFPVLLAIGYPPVVANVSNTLGLVPGSISGAVGYRRELTGQWIRVLRLGVAALLGGVVGAGLLLVLPPSAFETIVPVLIVLALLLVVLQPWLARKVAALQEEPHPHGGLSLQLAIFGTGIYGGYFGAAQGVLMLALMGILMEETLQRINAVKNVLAAIVNLTSGIVFVLVADVAWLVVLLLAGGSIVGGVFGARVGRKLPAIWLRAVIVVVGIAAILQILTR